MMDKSNIWEQLRRVQHQLKHGSLDTQDEAINDLQHQLEESCFSLFPSFLYPQLVDVLNFYCTDILPRLSMSDKDQQSVQEGFERTIFRLNTQEQIAKDQERRFKQFFHQVKSGLFTSVQEIVAAIHTIIVSQTDEISFSGNIQHDKELEKQYHKLKKSPFTLSYILPFFQTFISRTLPEELKGQFEHIKAIFWDQLYDCVQMKVALVNTVDKHSLLTRLDIETTLRSFGTDELTFENRIDDRMYFSCCHALQAARHYLENIFPNHLKDLSLHLRCSFQDPIVEYHDASISLAVGLKVIGDVLDMEIDPHVVVSGEVDGAGIILPVEHLAEKFEAVERHSEVSTFYLPENNHYEADSRVSIEKFQTFSEVVDTYYRGQFQKQSPPNRTLKDTLDMPQVLTGPSRSIFYHPVSERDVWLVEYAEDVYRKHCDYQKATKILTSTLKEFRHYQASPEVLQLKAQAFGHLGFVSFQQYHPQKTLKAYKQAFSLWKALNDTGHQADMLLRIGGVYRETATLSGIKRNADIALKYYDEVYDLLKPSMKTFKTSMGRYYLALGQLYYWIDEYDKSEECCRTGMNYFDETDKTQWHQVYKQHLGRSLVKTGSYDEAFDIFERTSESIYLQDPYDQARTAWALCDLYLSIGKKEKGLEYLREVLTMVRNTGAHMFVPILQQILKAHQLPPSFIDSLESLKS